MSLGKKFVLRFIFVIFIATISFFLPTKKLSAKESFQKFNHFFVPADDFFSEKKIIWQEETLTIPTTIWERRSKLINKITEKRNTIDYIVRENTLLSINAENFFNNAFVLKGKKVYRSPFYIFIRKKGENIKIVERVKKTEEKKISVNISIDEQAPQVELIPISQHFKIKDDAIFFGKKIDLMVKIKDDLSYLEEVIIESTKENKKVKIIANEKFKDNKKVFVRTISLYSRAKKETFFIKIKAKDQLKNTITQIFPLRSVEEKPRVEVFLKKDNTLSKITKKKLEYYFLELEPKEKVVVLLQSFDKKTNIYALLEEKHDDKNISQQRLFKKIKKDDAIKIDQSGYLYFYAIDELGNRSSIEYLQIIKKKKELEVNINPL